MAAKTKKPVTKTTRRRPRKLLSGGNPQVAKGLGDEPVRAYIASIPDWKRSVAREVDALISRVIPGVRKAVKYNSPLYGAEGRNDWFLGVHCFTDYLKLSFFRGAMLTPPPPGCSKQKLVRYLDIRRGVALDHGQLAAWVKQAASLPGEKL